MSPENAHKLIRIYIGGLILGVNTLYMLSCFLKQFALVGKGLMISRRYVSRCFMKSGKCHVPLESFPRAVCNGRSVEAI